MAMAITGMSPPLDIPWKRIGVSGDMIDLQAGDLTFHQKMAIVNRSSLL
jgi:hypothetical protein